MKWDRPRKRGLGLLLLVGVIAAGTIVAGLIWRGEYPTEQTAERGFIIEEDFTKVRKIMVRTNAAKEIVTMGGGSEFVDQQWDDGSVAAAGEDFGKKLLRSFFSGTPDWQLRLHGTLMVRTLDPYIRNGEDGNSIVTLDQSVEIMPDHLQSDTKLIESSGRLLGYAMTTRLEREKEQTRVTLKLTQKINTDAPWFAHRIADRRVLASAGQTLANQEDAMRQLIEENRDKKWLLPIK